VHRSTGQTRDEPGVDGPHGEIARLRPASQLRMLVEHPPDLGAGEVGIEHQARARSHVVLVAGVLEARAQVGGPAVLPHDGAMHGLEGLAIPEHDGLTLVGDADGLHLRLRRSLESAAGHAPSDFPDLQGVVLDPPRMGKILGEFRVGAAEDTAILGNDEAGGSRGALVD